MKINKGIFALFAVALLGIGFVSAYNGWMSPEDHEKVESAIEAGDYDSWVEAHTSLLTRDNFDLALERHSTMSQMRILMEDLRDAREAGDEDLILELETQLEELRPEGFNGMKGQFQGKGQGMHSRQGELQMIGNCPYAN